MSPRSLSLESMHKLSCACLMRPPGSVWTQCWKKEQQNHCVKDFFFQERPDNFSCIKKSLPDLLLHHKVSWLKRHQVAAQAGSSTSRYASAYHLRSNPIPERTEQVTFKIIWNQSLLSMGKQRHIPGFHHWNGTGKDPLCCGTGGPECQYTCLIDLLSLLHFLQEFGALGIHFPNTT